jgi:hypothetical protein
MTRGVSQRGTKACSAPLFGDRSSRTSSTLGPSHSTFLINVDDLRAISASRIDRVCVLAAVALPLRGLKTWRILPGFLATEIFLLV